MFRPVLAFSLLLTAPSAVAQTPQPQADEQAQIAAMVEERADGSVVQRASGFFVFPDALGPYRRVGIRILAPDDFMARYGSEGPDSGGSWLDLIAYRAKQPFQKEAEGVDGLIGERWTATKVNSPAQLPGSANGALQAWYHARQESLVGTTGFVLNQRGGWFIKVRATSPDAAGVKVLKTMTDAIAAVAWDWYPAQQTSWLLRPAPSPAPLPSSH